jgi:chromosome segregation ATPase
MPRLTKIRITGNKYDGFQKQHRNSIFDLEADHSLFTLQNGSGKGVMLQLISQLLLPGTAWGKRNGNKLEGMFYDRYQVFQPYSFHVVLEWRLEGAEDKKLLTGICVSAHKQQSTTDEEGKVGLKYFLYTHQYQGNSRFSLINLPLYTKSSDQVLEYERMEEFIDQNRADFIKYSKTAVSSLNSEYYQYLSSHGIYRSEWEIMKNINRSEGGLEKYFSQARDNKALFDQLIIPAVSESISYYNEREKNSLLNIFVDNVKIARNLPELLSRREDLKTLSQMVDPLLSDAEQGLRLKETREMIRERGNNYLRGIEDRRTFLDNELRRSQREKEKAEARIKELNFEAENLKYVKKIRALKQLRLEQEEAEKDYQKLQQEITNLNAEKLQLQLNQKQLELTKLEAEAAQKREKISSLKERTEFKELEAEIAELKEKTAAELPALNQKVRASVTNYYSYQKYLQNQTEKLEQREKKLEQKIRDEQQLKIEYEHQAAKLETEKKELARFFNPLELESPEYLLQNLKNDSENLNSKLDKLEEDLKEKEEEKEKLQAEKQELALKAAAGETKLENLKAELKKQEQAEEEIFSQLLKNLNLDKFKEFYSKQWLQQQKNELLKLITEKKESLQELNARNFELQLDLNLNDREYWVASLEQKRLYQKIKELDIRVYYGSEFLFELVDEREKYLEDYPLLPYGLVVVYESDWEKIKANISIDEISHFAVPIFINHQLEGEQTELPFKLLCGKEKNFTENQKNFEQWFSGLKNKEAEIRETISILERKLKNLNQLNYRAETMLAEESAVEIETELKKEESEQESLQTEIKKYEKRLKNMAEKISGLQKEYARKEKELTELQKNQEKVEVFLEAKRELEQKEDRYREAVAELERLDGLLSENKSEQKQRQKAELRLENDYQNWLQDYRDFAGRLKEMLTDKEAEIKKEFKAEDLNISARDNYPQFFDFQGHKSYQNFSQILELQKKEEEKAAELKYLEAGLQKTLTEISDLEVELNELAEDWEQRQYNFKNQTQLKLALEEIKEQLKNLQSEAKKLNEEILVRRGQLETKENELQEKAAEIKERFQRTVQSWEQTDLTVKELEIKKELSDNREYLSKLEEMILNYKQKLQTYNNLSNKLEYYQLDSTKGELNAGIKEELKDSPAAVIEGWINDYQNIEAKLKSLREKTEDNFYQFKNDVKDLVENNTLKNSINEKLLHNFRASDYQYNFEMLNSFKEYINNELNTIDRNKTEAEEARQQWAERSAIHVMRLITSMKEMISNMVYHNQRGFAFPLVRLRRDDLLPEDEEEVIAELKEYFLELINKFNREEIEVEALPDYKLKEYCGDAALFSRALRGRYPVLQVYKMTEKNEFLHARPQDYFYSDWESVIQGKGNGPEGSGGQSLSINAFMMMMLLNYKKQRFDKTNPWTVLFLDNPFGKASASHVLDPIFKIADKLNFQLLAFAAPEIIKTEISERFPVFWALEIGDTERNQGVVKGQVIYGERRAKVD